MALLSKAKHLLTGESAEHQAYEYLLTQNLTLIAKNYRSKVGEIDIIMQDKQTIVFIEVRYRKNSIYGSGAESVTLSKQRKLIKTASFYLQCHPQANQFSARFDVISMSAKPNSINNEINWIKDAFQA